MYSTLCKVHRSILSFSKAVDDNKWDSDFDLTHNLGDDEYHYHHHCQSSDIRYQVDQTKSKLHFDFGQLDKILEGEFRPGHFSGKYREY